MTKKTKEIDTDAQKVKYPKTIILLIAAITATMSAGFGHTTDIFQYIGSIVGCYLMYYIAYLIVRKVFTPKKVKVE